MVRLRACTTQIMVGGGGQAASVMVLVRGSVSRDFKNTTHPKHCDHKDEGGQHYEHIFFA